jgi:hypothetical protein
VFRIRLVRPCSAWTAKASGDPACSASLCCSRSDALTRSAVFQDCPEPISVSHDHAHRRRSGRSCPSRTRAIRRDQSANVSPTPQGCAPAVQVADYGGVGHRAVGIVENNGEKVALISIRDLRQGVDVAVEAGVLGGFRGHAATVSARSVSTPRSKRAPARTKATRWGA